MDNIYITGRGLVTPIGIGLEANAASLRDGKSGIVYVPEWRDEGLESNVGGLISGDLECPLFNQKNQRYMPDNAKYAIIAAYEAIIEAGLDFEEIKTANVAVILGCAGSAYTHIFAGAARMRENNAKGRGVRLSPFIVPQVMPSSAVANLSLILGLTGESYDISSACASGAHALTIAARMIQAGLYDIVITGGADEVNWVQTLGFDAMRALSRKYNDTPEKASRPFDKDRDGFVIAAGAGVVIMESEKRVQARGAKPVAKLTGAVANSNASDMVVPNAESSATLMRAALADAGLVPEDIDYINTHGTATPIGDPIEMRAIQSVFGELNPGPVINSTKSMTGHMIGATGAAEAIFTSLMIERGFISKSLNLENPEDDFAWANFAQESRLNARVRHGLSNSFGFGGTNSCLVLSEV